MVHFTNTTYSDHIERTGMYQSLEKYTLYSYINYLNTVPKVFGSSACNGHNYFLNASADICML